MQRAIACKFIAFDRKISLYRVRAVPTLLAERSLSDAPRTLGYNVSHISMAISERTGDRFQIITLTRQTFSSYTCKEKKQHNDTHVKSFVKQR